MGKVYTSFKTVSRAFNKVRTELWKLGVLWDGSKLDGGGLTYLPFAPISALGGYMGFYDPNTGEIKFPSVYLPIQSLWKDLGAKANAPDVFRHEFAHAIVDFYPGAVSLGVSPDASDAEVKKAWKKKLAAFHPDKIQGKDLDPEWVELANQKSTEINQAYETIKAARR